MVGDIIVVRKECTIVGTSGHAAVILDTGTIAEYPKIGYRYWAGPLYVWLYERGDMTVLRYRNFTPEFRERFLENARKLTSAYWGFTFKKENDTVFYCSQYVWYLYHKTAEDLGYELDLDSDRGIVVFPYDFIGSKELEPVPFDRVLPEGIISD